MNKAIKRKWVKALRSGLYKQGSGKLRSERDEGDVRYCCLGVLCDILGVENFTGMSVPYQKALDEIGLDYDEHEQINDNATHAANKLANFNDRGRSFNWIASYIERYL